MPRRRRGPVCRPRFLPLLASLVALASFPPVGAAGQVPASDDEAYYRLVSERIIGLEHRGASQRTIDRALEREFGWVLVGRASTTSLDAAFSENTDVTLSIPSVYFNTTSGRYEASATFAWKSCADSWTGHIEPCYLRDYSGTRMGGDDGFGIRVSKEVSRRSQSFVVATIDNCRTWYANPADADGWGVVYRNQDAFMDPCGTSNYNWHRGAIVFSFLMLPGCPKGQYQLSTKLAHTWSSTGVSGISVSSSGISVTFSATDHQWTAVSNPRTFYPCGR